MISPEHEAILRECSKDAAAYQRLHDLYIQCATALTTTDIAHGHRRYHALFDQSNDAVFMLDLDGNHIEVNARGADMLGYAPDQMRGMSYRDLITPDEFVEADNIRERLLAGERVEPYQRQFKRKDGTVLPVEINVECIFDDAGRPLHIQSIVRDISERVDLLETIRMAEQRYRSIITAMAEGIVMQAAGGEIIEANPAAQRILGMSIDQMMGRTSLDPTWQSIHEDGTDFPGEDHPAMVCLRTGEPQYNVIMGVRKPDGVLTWISINSEPLFRNSDDDSPYAVVATFTDITELQVSHQAAVKLAVQQERMTFITEFIRDASHEFRTPLSIISTGAYFVSRVDNLEKRRQQTDKILHQVDRLSALVDTLLLMSRLSNVPDMTLNKVWVGTLLNQVLQILDAKRAEKNLTFDVVMPADEVTIQADTRLILEAFRQLVDNAVRYSKPDGEIIIRTTVHTDTVVIDITDKGIGIEQENMPHIFERFWRLDEAHTEPGFGLGLPITQRIIHLHDGEIYVMSEPDKGTTVTVYLSIG